MRTLMLLASVLMIGSGIFCVANGSAAFLTVAFIVGLVYAVMGLVEIITGLRADFDITENAVSITRDGIIMLIFGIVILSGQVLEDNTAQMLIAMWLMIEGVLAFSSTRLDLREITPEERVSVLVNSVMLALGIYIFFNTSMFNLSGTMLIGIGLIVLGFRRFRESFLIEYTRPGFITGNEEKLREALDDEKRALAKAKEGIREQKNAQRRIRKIREDIAAEEELKQNAAMRRREMELDMEIAGEILTDVSEYEHK